MGLYLIEATYTAEAIAAQLKNPQDRTVMLRAAIEAHGGRLLGVGFTAGPPGIVAIQEMPDDTSNAAALLTVFSSGAFIEDRVTPLLSPEQWVEALSGQGFPEYEPVR
jgi:uncharacterized protein with GYD domain